MAKGRARERMAASKRALEMSLSLKRYSVRFLLVGRALEDSRLDNLDILNGAAVGADRAGLNLANDVHTLKNAAENDVLAIEPSGLDGGDEEF